MSNEHLQVALSIGSSLGICGETEPLQTIIDCLGCLAPMDTIAYNDKKAQVVVRSNGAWATEPKRILRENCEGLLGGERISMAGWETENESRK